MKRTPLAIVVIMLIGCGPSDNDPISGPGGVGVPGVRSNGAHGDRETKLPSLERLTGDTDRVPDVMNGLIAHIYAVRPDAEQIGPGWGYGVSGKAKKADSKYTREIYERPETRQFVSTSFERADSVSNAAARLKQWMGSNPIEPVADLGDEAFRFTRRPAIYFRRANVVVKVSCSGSTSEGSLIPVANVIDQRIRDTLKQ